MRPEVAERGAYQRLRIANPPYSRMQICATRLRPLDIQLYSVCEGISEFIIYFLVIFSPWAFGATQPWSIWTVNIAGFALGLLLAVKLVLRCAKGYRSPRWDECARKFFPAFLAILTVLFLTYCLVSAMNARATFREDTLTFDYHERIAWLPHSFDATATWSAFWRYLGLACAFWAIIDWLPGKTSAEQRARSWNPAKPTATGMPLFPERLRRLLWVLALNGALLGVEGIVQRLANSPRLLFLVLPRIHQTAVTQFGPYAYRSNAAQYFNLLWPVCLGFWWTLKLTRGTGKAHHVVLVCAAVMATCPLISTSRGGAIVALGIAAIATVFLLATHFLLPAHSNSRAGGKTLLAIVIFFCASLGFGLVLGWRTLGPRLEQLDDGFEGRRLMYDTARPMAEDFPLYGTGPGTFETASYLYPRPDIFWPPQLHNDWLETRITFGYVGCALLCLALGTIAMRWLIRGGIHGGRRFAALAWLAIGGCLAHARFDFPFQVHSILLLFLVLCAILFSLSKERGL